MVKNTYTTRFGIGDNVVLDGHADMKVVVTGIAIYSWDVQYQVAWVQNGSNHECWVPQLRLSPVNS